MVREARCDVTAREIDTAGDGFFAAFDGPARAVLSDESRRDYGHFDGENTVCCVHETASRY
jgi:hypothetical protein